MLTRIKVGQIPWDGCALSLPDVSETVNAVRREGDPAVARIARKVGDPPPRSISSAEIRAAYEGLDQPLLDAIHSTAERIEEFAKLQRASLGDIEMNAEGLTIGHRMTPIQTVGMYVPGGRYPLPSTVLMCAIPARVAGVSHITMCTPRATPATLAAARIADVDECFEIGGAQAIAAMAYGTQTVPKVDVIVGPGNAYVTAAKRYVFGDCGIDLLAGPSELVVVASSDVNAAEIASDLLAQAEHDVMARVLLIAEDEELPKKVERELQQQLVSLATAEVAREAIRRNGYFAVGRLDDIADWIDAIAPEHLELHGKRAEAIADDVQCFGTLFVGSGAPSVFGDYGIGPNHVLPTSSNARFASGLSVATFLTVRAYIRSSLPSNSLFHDSVDMLATVEGLDAHRLAAKSRKTTANAAC